MPNHADLSARCMAALSDLIQEQGWALSDPQRRAYAAAVGALMAPEDGAAVLRQRLTFYHLDHELVGSLCDPGHHEHAAAWEVWLASALRIVQHSGLADAGSPLLGAEDLAQVALEELLRSLPTFEYRSRFSTWAYTVIVRAARRHRGALQAAKRDGLTVSLDTTMAGPGPEVNAHEHPEQATAVKALAELVQAVLMEERDARLARIFQLWAIEDWRLAEIARAVGLDTSRVSVLLKEARELLRRSPALRAWLDEPLDEGG